MFPSNRLNNECQTSYLRLTLCSMTQKSKFNFFSFCDMNIRRTLGHPMTGPIWEPMWSNFGTPGTNLDPFEFSQSSPWAGELFVNPKLEYAYMML